MLLWDGRSQFLVQPVGCLKVPARKSFFMQINVFVNTTGIFGLSEVWKDTEFFNSSNNYSQQIKVFFNKLCKIQFLEKIQVNYRRLTTNWRMKEWKIKFWLETNQVSRDVNLNSFLSERRICLPSDQLEKISPNFFVFGD